MQSLISAIQDTPIPTILVVGGIVFLLLAVTTQLTGTIKTVPQARKWAGGFGVVLLAAGIVLSILEPGTKPPPPERGAAINIPATSYSASENIEVGTAGKYGANVIHNASPYGHQSNMVEYQFNSSTAGKYELYVEYAAAQPRPVQITLNGKTVTDNGLAEATGGWTIEYQKLLPQGNVTLKKGQNSIKLYRSDVFPHIRKIELRPL